MMPAGPAGARQRFADVPKARGARIGPRPGRSSRVIRREVERVGTYVSLWIPAVILAVVMLFFLIYYLTS
jgi:hypothetical protein